MIIYGLLSSIFLFLSIFLFWKFYNAYKIFDSAKDNLFYYLKSLNDIEAMIALGFINPFGEYEKWHVRSSKMREYIESRSDLIKNDKIGEFINDMDIFDKSYIRYYVTGCLCVFLFFSVIFIKL